MISEEKLKDCEAALDTGRKAVEILLQMAKEKEDAESKTRLLKAAVEMAKSVTKAENDLRTGNPHRLVYISREAIEDSLENGNTAELMRMVAEEAKQKSGDFYFDKTRQA